MINYDKFLAPAVTSLAPSGIRKFFDIAAEMKDVISLGVGEPDFVTPWAIRESGIYSLEKGHTHYSANSGLIELLEEINRQSEKANVITNVLLELNLGEEQKGGFPLENLSDVLSLTKNYSNVKVKGLMAMLPDSEDTLLLESLAKKVRENYDNFKALYPFEYLSMGMSNDYKLCIENGSNMIRVGSKIFGRRY